MTEFKIPELGENVASGDVTRVLVKVGDTIALEQPVVELETDKATVEVPSSVAGVVKDIRVKQGDKVTVGAVVLTVDENGAGSAPAAKPSEPARETQPAQAESPSPAKSPEEVDQPVAGGPEQNKAAGGAEQNKVAGGLQASGRSDQATGPRSDQKVVAMSRPGRPEPVPARGAEAVKPPAPPSRID